MRKFSKLLIPCFFLANLGGVIAQEEAPAMVGVQTFKDTRLVNSNSVETLPKQKLDIRFTHLFGDVAGDNGGSSTLWGLENISDIALGIDYGVTDQLTIGLFRSKGAGLMPDGRPGLRQLMNLTLKYRVLSQKTGGGSPVSVTLRGLTTMSTAKKVENNPEVLNSFPEFSHRLAYHGELMVARNFASWLSIQVKGGYTHRNFVLFGDESDIASVGGAARIQLFKGFGLILDSTFPLSEHRVRSEGFLPILGVGFEIETKSSLFQLNFTNATAITETDYIPYTTSDWSDGQFRLGISVSRLINL